MGERGDDALLQLRARRVGFFTEGKELWAAFLLKRKNVSSTIHGKKRARIFLIGREGIELGLALGRKW